MVTHEGSLSIHANGQLLFELGVDGKVFAGENFERDCPLLFRAMVYRYPRWFGEAVAHFLRTQAASPGADGPAGIRGALGGSRVEARTAAVIWATVCEQLAVRAEEAGLEGEQRELDRRAMQEAALPRAEDPPQAA